MAEAMHVGAAEDPGHDVCHVIHVEVQVGAVARQDNCEKETQNRGDAASPKSEQTRRMILL